MHQWFGLLILQSDAFDQLSKQTHLSPPIYIRQRHENKLFPSSTYNHYVPSLSHPCCCRCMQLWVKFCCAKLVNHCIRSSAISQRKIAPRMDKRERKGIAEYNSVRDEEQCCCPKLETAVTGLTLWHLVSQLKYCFPNASWVQILRVANLHIFLFNLHLNSRWFVNPDS